MLKLWLSWKFKWHKSQGNLPKWNFNGMWLWFSYTDFIDEVKQRKQREKETS